MIKENNKSRRKKDGRERERANNKKRKRKEKKQGYQMAVLCQSQEINKALN
jgi:hypothetical protein